MLTGLIFDLFFKARIANEKNKIALTKIHNSLKIGSNSEKIIESFKMYQTGELEISTDSVNTSISMPYEFGATDWVLFCKTENGTIKSVKMRTSDGMEHFPKEAPNDK